MVCEFPVWVHLARKTPVRAAVRGRVFEIGAPEQPDGEVLLTVWTAGRPVGHVLATEPPVFRRVGVRATPEPRPVSGIPELLECAAQVRRSEVAAPRTAAPPAVGAGQAVEGRSRR